MYAVHFIKINEVGDWVYLNVTAFAWKKNNLRCLFKHHNFEIQHTKEEYILACRWKKKTRGRTQYQYLYAILQKLDSADPNLKKFKSKTKRLLNTAFQSSIYPPSVNQKKKKKAIPLFHSSMDKAKGYTSTYHT